MTMLVSPPSNPVPLFLSTGEAVAGAADYVDPAAGLRGWVLDASAPGRPVRLQARHGSVVLAESVAVLDRPDIDRVVGRTTQCGFLLGWSRFDTRALARVAATAPSDPIAIVVAATGRPVQFVCEPPTSADILAAIKASPVGDLAPDFHELNEYLEIEASGLFDLGYYMRTHAGGMLDGMVPLLDYIRRGEATGARPNFYFDPASYAADAGLPGRAGSLLHFLRAAAATGVAPSVHFDGRWYEREFGVPRGPRSVAHFLASRPRNPPNRWFDPEFYVAESRIGPDVDPYEHFATVGARQGLLPNPRLKADADRGSVSEDAARYLASIGAVPPKPIAGPQTPPALRIAPALPAAALPMAMRPGAPAPVTDGLATAEAALQAMTAAELAATVAAAEADMARGAPGNRNAALTLALARGLAGDGAGAARAAVVFLSDPAVSEPGVHPDVLPRLARAAHAVFEAQRSEEALAVYRLLHQRGFRDYLVLVRLVEATLLTGDSASAAPYAQELERDYADRLDVWAIAALSRYHQARGDRRRAVSMLAALPPLPRDSVAAEALVLHRLVECGAVDEASARLSRLPDSDDALLYAARLRIAVRSGDAPQLARLFAMPSLPTLPDWMIAEAVFVLSNPGFLPLHVAQPLLERLDGLLGSRVSANPRLLHPRMHYLLQSKRWEDLGLIFQEIEGSELAAERETLLRQLEYYCHADNPQGAERIYRDHFQNTHLNKWEGMTVLRLLSELKRWDEAARVLLQHVRQGFGFGGAQHLAMRIVRKGAIHEALLDAAAPTGTSLRDPELDAFLRLVEEDLSVLRSARALTLSLGRPDMSSAYRSNWVFPTHHKADNDRQPNCMFLCVNQKYFLSLLTFLCSFFGQSPQVECKVFVFLDGDVPKHWYGAIPMVASRFGRSVELVQEQEFVPREVEHREEYGFFAGGGHLARAAYFRLYATRYLLKNHGFSRGVYIDTDTVCRGDLSPMFEFDLGGRLVGAASEEYSLDVINAASRHGLEPSEYFNSGVLILPMADLGLSDAIEAAIRVSETEQERLMFQDQCALNIAFRGHVRPLPQRFNFFLRPHRERNGHLEDGLILHFVDKPKPWDIVFDRSYREEWRVWALLLGSILPQGLYVDVFAAANRD
jgi:lipopolysaccharide biosynthesis glycosyltransferase